MFHFQQFQISKNMISCGINFTVCVDCEGFIWSFGENHYGTNDGQLGTGNKTKFNVPQNSQHPLRYSNESFFCFIMFFLICFMLIFSIIIKLTSTILLIVYIPNWWEDQKQKMGNYSYS